MKRATEAVDDAVIGALDRISEWARRWEMSFNVKKCRVMHFGKKNIRYEYKMNGCVLAKVREEKDLGVWNG